MPSKGTSLVLSLVALGDNNVKPKVILYNATSVDGRTQGFAIDMGLFYSLAQQWDEHVSLVGGTSQKTFFNDLTSENGDVIPLRLIESKVEAQGILRLSYALLNCQPL